MPIVAFLLLATLVTFGIQYYVSDQAVSTEFFRAHKTITHTGQLLRWGIIIASLAAILFLALIAAGVFRLTHRIVRPVHTLHRALDELRAGDLGVRVVFHRDDEFEEVGRSLNGLIDEFSSTLDAVHALVDRLIALVPPSAASADHPSDASELRRIVSELDQKLEFFRMTPRRTIEDHS
jgi:methyl-accepting chemotaxis protein